MSEQRDEECKRTVRVAEIDVDGERTPGQTVAPLYDAQLVSATVNMWSITGYEKVEEFPNTWTSYQQSWLLTPVAK